jgi:hypothetical protein
MSFKRYNSSNGYRFRTGYIGGEGELTWDNSNGLRLHDGSTSGGNVVATFNSGGKLAFPTEVDAPVGFTTQSFGMGDLFAWQDGNYWTIATGNVSTGNFGDTGISLSPGIESSTYIQLPADFDANISPVTLVNSDTGNVQIGSNSKYWTFDNTGGLNLPGTVITSTVTPTPTNDPVYPTAIDLTKTVNKLSDNAGSYYTLANGVEGQIMYLVPTTGTTNANTIVNVGNARILNATATTTANVFTDVNFNPFGTYSSEQPTNVVTMLFTDGAWQSSGGYWD